MLSAREDEPFSSFVERVGLSRFQVPVHPCQRTTKVILMFKAPYW